MGRRRKPFLVEKVKMTGIADKGKAVGRDEEGRVMFVEGAVPGDIVDVLVFKKKKGFLMGQAQTVHELSEDRTEAFCEHFGVCGGCKWQNLSYEAQLKHKEVVVHNALQRIGKVNVEAFLPILGAEEIKMYRNKVEFAFSNKRWLTNEEIKSDVTNQVDVLGFHKAGVFDKVLDIKECWLQQDPSNAIRNASKEIATEQGLDFFDMRNNKGFIRNMFIRITDVGEILLIYSFYENDQGKIKTYLDAILERFHQITTICYCINAKVNDYVMDLNMHTYYGKGYIEEQLNHVRFKIGPKSFFQTNTKQAIRLFDVVVDFAGLTGVENVYDLYTGLGSIGLYVARNCKQMVGIEEIPEAIEDAKVNADLNDIENAIFYAGDVKDILTDEFAEKHGKPDVLITDPPRAGMHPKVVEMLLKLAAPRLVYVSCNPATQARDIQLLSEKYDVLKLRPVDMFPHTHHIESVALLELKKQ